jgi:hypothetical protein
MCILEEAEGRGGEEGGKSGGVTWFTAGVARHARSDGEQSGGDEEDDGASTAQEEAVRGRRGIIPLIPFRSALCGVCMCVSGWACVACVFAK